MPDTVIVAIDIGNNDRDEYRFDFAARTVSRAASNGDAPDLAPFLQARLNFGTTKPRLAGRQTDEFTGITDSWESVPGAAAAVCDDIGLTVQEWWLDAA